MPVKPEIHKLTRSLFAAGGGQGSDPDRYQRKAQQMYHQWVAEAAYYRWIDRGRPLWDSLADWVAAEAEYQRRTAEGGDVFLPGQMRRQAIEVAAYCNYLHRDGVGDPDADWLAAENVAHRS